MIVSVDTSIKTPLPKQQRGFTLIELVTVMVLLGILSAVVAPKFSTREGYSDYAARDQIIAAARLVQQRAMYDNAATSCYRLLITGNTINAQQGLDGDLDGVFDYANIGPADTWLSGIAIESGASVDDVEVYFDGLGSGLGSGSDCSGTPQRLDIAINSLSNLGVCIYDTGYIQAC